MDIQQRYSDTLTYLYAQLPMFHRIGAAAYKADLTNTIQLLEKVGNPHRHWPSIHIAGTNGKGSSSHMLAAALQQNGYKTGLYTSPHLLDFRERIRINGIMIPQAFVVETIAELKSKIEELQPSFFELTVALCFHYFAQEKVDIAVIETGLGGRLDSTNVIAPELSLITNIALDHMNLLGDTLDKIATEKAGIIKSNTPAIISQHTSVDEVFITKAAAVNAPLFFAEDQISSSDLGFTANHKRAIRIDNLTDWPEWNGRILELDLGGSYQYKNVKGVLAALVQLRKKGYELTVEHCLDGMSNAKAITGLRGRWELLQTEPKIIADIAHNEAGITEVVQQLAQLSYKQLHIVFGAVQDKAVEKVLQLLPADAQYYWCAPDLPRALPVADLASKANAANRNGAVYSSVEEACQAAQKNAFGHDLILITGSNFVVAEALPLFDSNHEYPRSTT